MRHRVGLLASLALLGFTGLAESAQITSGPFPTEIKTSGACYVRNTGTTPVTVQVSLFSNNGTIVNFDNCNDGPLPGGQTCVILVNDLPDASFAACTAIASSVSKLRGTFELREVVDGVLRVIAAEELN